MLLRFAPSGLSAMTKEFDKRDVCAVVPSRQGVPLRLAGRDDDKEGNGPGGGSKYDTGTVTKTRPKTKRPSLYRVLLLNDDYTPMEFVVLVLQDVFNKSREEAMRIMLHVHNQGVGECGIYPFEVAETKVTRVMDTARKNQHPLQCVMEKE